MRHIFAASILFAAGCMLSPALADTPAPTARWSEQKANDWYKNQPWLVGANFAPAYAINQFEMWQADTFDIEAIDKELAWAKSLGFNNMRVYLHHMLWEQDSKGLIERMEKYLEVSDKHKIGTMFVLFDSVWDPNPAPGKQRDPKPGVHNSGWVQSPGAADLQNKDRHKLLEEYVKGIVSHFKDDKRITVWDVWNEPDNKVPQYQEPKGTPIPPNKIELMIPLLKKTFQWCREAGATQPLTSGVWIGQWPDADKLTETEKTQLENSDVISFHSYDNLDKMKQCVTNLKRYNRPMLCTEYMARGNDSYFDPIMGYLKSEKVGAYNWGFVSGKSQTIFPWDSWEKKYGAEPPLWFHDIFRGDGTPYRQAEVDYIRSLTGAKDTSTTGSK